MGAVLFVILFLGMELSKLLLLFQLASLVPVRACPVSMSPGAYAVSLLFMELGHRLLLVYASFNVDEGCGASCIITDKDTHRVHRRWQAPRSRPECDMLSRLERRVCQSQQNIHRHDEE